MAVLPPSIQNLLVALERLPGVGPKTAARLVFFLLRAPDEVSLDLANALARLKADTQLCRLCFHITQAGQDTCDICQNPRRDDGVLCVVEEPMDVMALEHTGGFQGRYHVLHGVLSPIEGIGPDDLRISPLIDRLKAGGIQEVILATNASMEGDSTAIYLRQQILPLGIRVTRLARGLPMGSDLEYADQNTILRALSGRQEMF
jgi:recombination protein RecR